MGAAVNALPGGEIVPAMDRGLLDAAEFNNATSDRILGFPDVSKVCMLQSFHQNAEQFEIMFNKTKYDALPAKMKAIIDNAVEAASRTCRGRRSTAIRRTTSRCRRRTRRQVLQDARLGPAARSSPSTTRPPPRSARTTRCSRRSRSRRSAFAERAVHWDLDTNVNRRMAYNHYFGKPAGKPAAKKA